MTSRLVLVLALSVPALSVPALTGCLEADPVDTTVDGPNGPVECQEVIHDGVAHAFGWPTKRQGGEVVAEDSACVWQLQSIGEITVWSVEGSGSAEERLDDECDRLSESGPLDDELRAAIAGEDRACAVGLDPEVQTGTAELVMITQDDVVIDVRVEAEALLRPEALRAGLRELARAAQAEW